MDTTFMAKPYPGQAGNGLRVHISLLDKHGNNIFTGEDPEQNAALRHAIGGVLRPCHGLHGLPLPNVDSTAASVRGSTCRAPSWGLDNHTVALRVPAGSPGRGTPGTSGGRCRRQPTCYWQRCWQAFITG